MTIFIILFSVLFLVLIFQVIKLLFLAIKKKELSKEVKKTLIVFLCSLFAFILVGMTVPESTKNAIKKEEELNKKAKEAKEAKKEAEKEKRQAESAKKKENNCVLGIFCEEEENKVSQDELKYEVLAKKKDTSNLTMNEYIMDILVQDNISEENLKKVIKKAGKEQIGNGDILYIRAYGDKKFFNLGGETHGMITYYPDGTVKNETYRAKKEIPSDKEKDIYIDYSKTLHETLKAKGNYTKQEEENIEEEINKKIAKKYGISPEEVEKIFDKVVIYQGM